MEPYKKWDEKIEEDAKCFFGMQNKFSSLNSYFYIYKNEKKTSKKMKHEIKNYLRNLYDEKEI